MKTTLSVFIFIFLTSTASAQEAPFPKNWCSEDRCSTPQEKIWNEFNNGLSPNWERMPEVISGSCYHSSRLYSNEVEHFSGFLIDQENDGFSFDGGISFFAPENPYKDLNVESARKRFTHNKTLRVEIFEDYGFFNANPASDTPIRYWFREGADTNIKMAIVFGSLDHTILCDLVRHSN